jgi:hypothetical protein
MTIANFVNVEWLHETVWCLAIKIRSVCRIIKETRDHLNVRLDTNVRVVLVDDHIERDHFCF